MKESSYVSFCQKLDNFVVPHFKNKDITKITPADILKWQDNLTALGYKFKYKKSIREVFVHFFNYLEIYNIPNPLKKVKGFRAKDEKRTEMLFWTEEDFAAFIPHVDDITYKTLFSLLYCTGCRKGEVLALHWSDFENNSIDINKTLTNKTIDKQYKETSPKSENAYRKILLPKTVVNLLNELKQSATGDYIFGGQKNIPFQTVTNRFDRYIKIANVKRIRVHDLRHSNASFLINHGENQLSTLYIIAQRLGDTTEMILETYGHLHLFPNKSENMLVKLDEFFNSCA